MIEDPLALLVVIFAITALAFWLARRFTWAGKVGASLLVIVFGAVLANLDLVPASSVVYSMLGGPVTSLAIVWLLFAVDLRDLKIAGPRMLGAFLIGVAGTATGALVAFALFGDFFPDDGWRLAGVMTGTYSGGSINFVSVGRSVDLSGSLFAAATAADNVVTTLWVGATLLLPVWLRRFYPPPRESPAGEGAGFEDPMHAPVSLSVLDVLLLTVLGLLLVLAAERTALLTPGVPSVIWLTTFALLVAQLPPVRALQGSIQLGTLALHLFFAIIGIGSRVDQMLEVGVQVFYFTVVVVAVHGVVLFVAARLVKLDAETTSVASQAAVGGPSTAIALAVARRRPELALPGAMVGLLGYALGTYAGVAVAYLLR
jgi:uncharacterized membrane protein